MTRTALEQTVGVAGAMRAAVRRPDCLGAPSIAVHGAKGPLASHTMVLDEPAKRAVARWPTSDEGTTGIDRLGAGFVGESTAADTGREGPNGRPRQESDLRPSL